MHYSGTDWRYYKRQLIAGIVLVPLFGAGLVILMMVWLKVRNSLFHFDTGRIEFLRNRDRNMSLAEIEEVKVENYRIRWSVSMADIRLLKLDGTSIKIYGVKGAQFIASAIEKNIELIQSRLSIEKTLLSNKKIDNPTPLEPFNDLVGLWQQGLISEEEFNAEKNKFSQT
jgi:hypothetical protein